MNRHQRRAATAQSQKTHERAAAIRLAMAALAKAGPTATGATLMLPDGEVLHLNAADAHALAGRLPGKGRG
jgi:hypothetical protein